MSTGLLIMFAGLMGAAGIALAAASTHAAPGPGLDSAAYMLLFHAAAVAALVGLLDRGLVWRPLGLAAAAGLVLGAGLFSGDIALRALAHARLFPMAAPTGGIVMMAAWLAVAIAGLVALLRG
jgi:uncharacterized membrane protein YgdD (TMEM256/DUF423 family)